LAELLLGVLAKVFLLRLVLPDSIAVLVGASFPGRMVIGEVDLAGLLNQSLDLAISLPQS
jgi:hypothetical protein